MKVGQKISFEIETWPNGSELTIKKFTSEIKDFIPDPLKRHESKCLVIIDGIKYGIPFSEIIEKLPAKGEQLLLF
jgi:hypothetical protein